jgi:cytochrome c5
MQRALLIAAALLVFGSGCSREAAPPEPEVTPKPVATAEPELDPVSGLKMTGDWEIVRANCTACHSPKLITQQRGTAQQWLTMIRWMQEKQNLWTFDPDTESKIIGYLAENYPPSDARRRAAIPPDLMPPNPYSTEN